MKIRLSKNYKAFGFFTFLAAFLLLAFTVYLVLYQIKPVFEERAQRKANEVSVTIINKACEQAYKSTLSENILNIDKDSTGKITSISTNSIEMNKLKSKIASEFEKITKENKNNTIYIPIGSITNFSVLQGVGYKIPVKVLYNGFSKLDFKDEFVSAGINQVKHKIYLTASVNMSIISATMVKATTVETEIPVCETVIVGDVPEFYGNNLGVVGR